MTTIVDNRISTNPHSLVAPASSYSNTEPVTLGRLLGITGKYLGDFVREFDADTILAKILPQTFNNTLTSSFRNMRSVTPE